MVPPSCSEIFLRGASESTRNVWESLGWAAWRGEDGWSALRLVGLQAGKAEMASKATLSGHSGPILERNDIHSLHGPIAIETPAWTLRKMIKHRDPLHRNTPRFCTHRSCMKIPRTNQLDPPRTILVSRMDQACSMKHILRCGCARAFLGKLTKRDLRQRRTTHEVHSAKHAGPLGWRGLSCQIRTPGHSGAAFRWGRAFLV